MMQNGHLTWIANFIWGIADDVLRDLYVRGKYRDVILPMTVIRRLDSLLEPTKQAVLDMKASLDKAKIVHQDQALRQASGQAFYNTSKFTLRDLKARTSQQQLKADFETYLDGFSPNVQDILEKFEFRNQIPRLSKADALGTLIEKLLSPDINLSPNPVLDGDGSVKHPGLDNHGMGTIFEELVRRFNEENNEEAGEHWTPRDAVRLMARLVLLPIADQIESGTYLLYDGACGTGGMLTIAEESLQQIAQEHGKQVATHLFGQEINAETYAIAKADLLLKGEGEAADNIVGGPEYSTLSNDAFPTRQFDFMLSNPPYGKSWKTDLERNNFGLVGYWSFNEGTGTIVGDFSGNQNHGTTTNIANPPTATSGWTNGKYGKAMRFDGTNDYVSISNSPSLNLTGTAVTVACWVKRFAPSASHEIMCGKTQSGSNDYLIFKQTATNRYHALIKTTGGENNLDSGITIRDGEWHHLAVTYDGSNERFYYDGAQVALGVVTGNLAGSSVPIRIGGRADGFDLNGIIDEVRIYSRALTADEVKKLYEMGATQVISPNKLGLVGHWSFNEGTSTHARDFSGKGNHGRLTNMGDGTGKWVNGRVGKALSFDGVDDFVRIATSTIFDVPSGGSLTAAAWIKITKDGIAILQLQRKSPNDSPLYYLQVGNTTAGGTANKFVAYLRNNSACALIPFNGVTTVNDGRWHHVVLTNANTLAKIYVDGREENSATWCGPPITVGSDIANRAIGTLCCSPQNLFDGLIDDVRIYNRALNAGEVRNLYESSKYVAINSSQNNQLTDGLVGMWSFNGPDMRGDTAYDRSGQGNNGTLTNGPRRVAGKVGQALQFDGMNNIIQITDAAQSGLDMGTNDFSIALWVKTSSSMNQDFTNKNDSANGPGYLFGVRNTGKVLAYIADGATTFTAESSTRVDDGAWHHVATVFDRDANLQTYIDGKADGTPTNISALSAANINGTSRFTIGADRSDASDFKGLLDEVRLYNRALSADEVRRLYLMGK